MSDPLPSATVVLLRERGGVEVLLVQRHHAMSVHGGAWAFPGGGVNAADRAAGGDQLDVARRAAVRETREECGLALDPGRLVPLSHWTTPVERSVRFATWFFLCERGEGELRADGGEVVAARWLSPGLALDERARGEIELPPPTFVTLWTLARHATVADALAAAVAPAPRFSPRPRAHGSGLCSLYEGDAAYEGGALDVRGPRRRLWMDGRDWRFEEGDASTEGRP